jgi:uncharacterized protein
MGIEKFGKLSFTTESKAADLVTYLEQGKVMTTKCKKCGTVYSPPRMDCPDCLVSDVEWIEVAGKGKLATFSTVYYGPTGFEDDAPYTIAVVKYPGYQVFGRISKAIKLEDLKVGMTLKAVPVKIGEDRISYEFQSA